MRYWRRCCWRRSSWFWIGSKLRGELTIFVLAGAALIPLSWLIGEAMDNLARHTGPGIGGFLNATFGNAPELIIAGYRRLRGPDRDRQGIARRLIELVAMGVAAVLPALVLRGGGTTRIGGALLPGRVRGARRCLLPLRRPLIVAVPHNRRR